MKIVLVVIIVLAIGLLLCKRFCKGCRRSDKVGPTGSEQSHP